jgi:hypothetical protein
LLGFRPPIIITDIGLLPGWAIRDRVLDLLVPRTDGIIVLGRNQINIIGHCWNTSAALHFIHQHIDTEFLSQRRFVEDGPILSVGDDPGPDFDTLLAATAELGTQVIAKTRMIENPPPTQPTTSTQGVC